MESSILIHQKVSQHLGLSEYEARVYVSLIMEGASEARKLSIRCGVPRTKVYATLKKLMEKGLVKIAGRAETLGHPILYSTTNRFLELLGIASIKDLPKPEELK